jgi:tRNA nucleotidyltransferase (CCA-adding enzyme)
VIILDGRRPSHVEFSDNILDDLSRRDFRMNAMAIDLNNYLNSNFTKDDILKNLIDPFGGLDDIRNEEINCVGNPMDRFNEDALRMMRAIRFSTKYDFTIGKETLDALYKSHNKLINVSTERITSEFNQILLNFNLNVNDLYDEKYLNKWRLTNFIIKKVIPEMYLLSEVTHNSSYHLYDVYTHSLLVCAGVCTNNIAVKLAALLHDVGKIYSESVDNEKLTKHFYNHAKESVSISQKILERMRYSNDEIEIVLKLIQYHDAELQNNKKSIKRLLNKVGENLFEDLLDIKISDRLNHIGISVSDDEKFNIMETYKEILYNEEVFSSKDLAISGNDLIELGYNPSPLFSEILNDCVDLCIVQPECNDKNYLLDYICKKY